MAVSPVSTVSDPRFIYEVIVGDECCIIEPEAEMEFEDCQLVSLSKKDGKMKEYVMVEESACQPEPTPISDAERGSFAIKSKKGKTKKRSILLHT
jgi:hypothetical protein